MSPAASGNRTGHGRSRHLPHDIEWEYHEDPDEVDCDLVELAACKVGGMCYFSRTLDPGADYSPPDHSQEFANVSVAFLFNPYGYIRLERPVVD